MPSFLTSFRSLTTFKVKPFSRQGSDLFSLCPRTLCSPVTEHVSLHVKSLCERWHVRNRDANNMHPFSWGITAIKKPKCIVFVTKKFSSMDACCSRVEVMILMRNWRLSTTVFRSRKWNVLLMISCILFAFFTSPQCALQTSGFCQMSLPSHFPL